MACNGLVAPLSRPPRAGDKDVEREIARKAGGQEEEGAQRPAALHEGVGDGQSAAT